MGKITRRRLWNIDVAAQTVPAKRARYQYPVRQIEVVKLYESQTTRFAEQGCLLKSLRDKVFPN